MAELAAGAVIAEEIVSTTIYTGVAAYAITQPTLPLKATFSQIATTASDDPKLSLSRSHHSVTVVKENAYIFGGKTSPDTLAGNEIHVISLLSHPDAEKKAVNQYAVIPAVEASKLASRTSTGTDVPHPRYNHAACQMNVLVAVFGGQGQDEAVINENGVLWLFNTANLAWEVVRAKDGPQSRTNATLSPLGNGVVLYGGRSGSGDQLRDVWHFEWATQSWTRLQDAPVAADHAVVAHETLYLLSFPSQLSVELHYTTLRKSENGELDAWTTESIPTNPLASKLIARDGALTVPLQFIHGRAYLLYLLGRDHADAWAIQLPPASPKWLAPKQAGATIKDSIRKAVGASTGTLDLAEVEIVIPKSLDDAPPGTAGKLHPGPRAWAAADVMEDGYTVVLWSGTSRLSPKGEEETTEGDGWMIRFN